MTVFIRVEVSNVKANFALISNDLSPICLCMFRNGCWSESCGGFDFMENLCKSNRASTQIKPFDNSKESVPPLYTETIVLKSGPNMVTGSPTQMKTLSVSSLERNTDLADCRFLASIRSMTT